MIVRSNLEERFISKLIRDTKKGDLKWDKNDRISLILPDSEKVVSKVYVTEIDEKKFRIYEFQFKSYKNIEDWDWVERVRLELFDTDGITLFKFNYDYSLYKLFNSIRKSNSGIDDLMKGFLKE